MERISVESSNIASIGYTEPTLEIEFKSRKGAGSIYQYANVPPEVWHAFLRAPSKGQFLGASVKGKYQATKIQ